VRSYLLDTQIILWLDEARERLPKHVWSALNSGGQHYYSAASAWEAAIKRASGDLLIAAPLSDAAQRYGLSALQITVVHGEAAGNLPLHHRDPFDRLIIAQARTERLTLVTSDRVFQRYDVDLLLA